MPDEGEDVGRIVTNGHQGVGVIITDEFKRRFFVQRKCEKYPIPEYRGFYSFFGGGLEEGESGQEALVRELFEELHETPAKNVEAELAYLKRFQVTARSQTYYFTLFESVLPESTFNDITDTSIFPVKEGKGKIVTRESILILPFIWGLEQVVRHYIGFIGQDYTPPRI